MKDHFIMYVFCHLLNSFSYYSLSISLKLTSRTCAHHIIARASQFEKICLFTLNYDRATDNLNQQFLICNTHNNISRTLVYPAIFSHFVLWQNILCEIIIRLSALFRRLEQA
jgi:hypothetical protein